MEPLRLRAILARTPGLLARHVFACLTDRAPLGAPLPSDLPTGCWVASFRNEAEPGSFDPMIT